MNLLTFIMEMPVQAGSRLLGPPRGNLFASGFGAALGLILLVLWVRFSPRLRIKRSSFWFWAGLAGCAIIGPILGGLLQ